MEFRYHCYLFNDIYWLIGAYVCVEMKIQHKSEYNSLLTNSFYVSSWAACFGLNSVTFSFISKFKKRIEINDLQSVFIHKIFMWREQFERIQNKVISKGILLVNRSYYVSYLQFTFHFSFQGWFASISVSVYVCQSMTCISNPGITTPSFWV
jgi:hypothetical protein